MRDGVLQQWYVHPANYYNSREGHEIHLVEKMNFVAKHCGCRADERTIHVRGNSVAIDTAATNNNRRVAFPLSGEEGVAWRSLPAGDSRHRHTPQKRQSLLVLDNHDDEFLYAHHCRCREE
jgi:hypothetical protein